MGGFGSLGDRVSRRQYRAQVDSNFDLFDTSWFRAELERMVKEKKHDADDLAAVQVFLDAWNNRRA